MPAAATAGANSGTKGAPVPSVANAPAASTIALAMIQPGSSDAVVTSARASPGDRSAPLASRSSRTGRRRQTCAATASHTRSRSTSAGP